MSSKVPTISAHKRWGHGLSTDADIFAGRARVAKPASHLAALVRPSSSSLTFLATLIELSFSSAWTLHTVHLSPEDHGVSRASSRRPPAHGHVVCPQLLASDHLRDQTCVSIRERTRFAK
jgi:hypothetical protein